MSEINLQTRVVSCLREQNPDAKCRSVIALNDVIKNHTQIIWPTEQTDDIDPPGRPDRPKCVPPSELPKRGSGFQSGRSALLHAIAHIEFNAINLALDAVVRFQNLPQAYYKDWIGVAVDEARHFKMLSNRLAEFGMRYGDLPAHQGLWDMALRTSTDPLDRMAIVPRMLEARGLDVTPAMIEKFKLADDDQSAELLNTILTEEIEHVKVGTRWFAFLCEERGIEPETTWFERVTHYFGNNILCPTNIKDRSLAGFNENEIRWLQQASRKPASSG